MRRVAVDLTREQMDVVRRSVARARRRKASPRELKALLLTEGVESNYEDVDHGHLDSEGALQQRPSQGWGPASEPLEKDVDQFLAAAAKLNRKGFKGTAGQLAQAVQRSAFPDRYDKRSAEVEGILAKLGPVGRAKAGVAPGLLTEAAPTPIEGSAAAEMDMGSSGVAGLIASLGGGRGQRPASAGVPTPGFAAQAVLPAAAQLPSSGGGGRQREDVSALLAGIRTPGVDMPVSRPSEAAGGSAVAPAGVTSSVSPARSGGSSAFPKLSGGYKGTQGAAQQLAAIGQDLGLQVTSEKRNNTNPHSGSRSDHDHGNKDAYAFDLSNGSRPTEEMDRAAFRIARKLGIKDYKMGQPIMRTVERNGVRVQIIYRGEGEAFGGNHMNHVHIGVKNLRRR